MIKRIIIKNGRKYIVNVCGWEDGIGPGSPTGTLWMQSTDGNWYAVSLTGTGVSTSININQTPLNLQTNDLGYQLLYGISDGNVYQIYLSGNSGSVTLNVNPSPVVNPGTNYKPFLVLHSITDGNYYKVYLNSSISTGYTVDTTLITSDTTLITSDNSGNSSLSLVINPNPLPN
jgi:hypothetical protein